MTYILLVVAAAFAAFCVWLAVRVVNRRERWAKWTLAALTVLVMYAASLWPACWLVQQSIVSERVAATIYDPLFAMEFRLPRVVQHACWRSAGVLGIEPAYLSVRDAPFHRRYPVGDFAFSWKNGEREFAITSALQNWITTTIEPDSWEELSGPGTIEYSLDTKSLELRQSRRVHGEIAALFGKIRVIRQDALTRGRDLDLPAVGHVLFGFFDEPKFRPGCTLISAGTRGDNLFVGDSMFADVNEVLEFLRQLPKDTLRSGVCWNDGHRSPESADIERLKRFCRERDVDLFIRPRYGNIIGQPLPSDWWIVRSSDSVYLDPE